MTNFIFDEEFIKNGYLDPEKVDQCKKVFRLRKGGLSITKIAENKNSYTVGIVIPKNQINIYKFYRIFKLRYAFEKQISLDELGSRIEKRLKYHLENIQNYKRITIMKKYGYGKRRLSRMLNLNIHLVDS